MLEGPLRTSFFSWLIGYNCEGICKTWFYRFFLEERIRWGVKYMGIVADVGDKDCSCYTIWNVNDLSTTSMISVIDDHENKRTFFNILTNHPMLPWYAKHMFYTAMYRTAYLSHWLKDLQKNFWKFSGNF